MFGADGQTAAELPKGRTRWPLFFPFRVTTLSSFSLSSIACPPVRSIGCTRGPPQQPRASPLQRAAVSTLELRSFVDKQEQNLSSLPRSSFSWPSRTEAAPPSLSSASSFNLRDDTVQRQQHIKRRTGSFLAAAFALTGPLRFSCAASLFPDTQLQTQRLQQKRRLFFSDTRRQTHCVQQERNAARERKPTDAPSRPSPPFARGVY